MMRSYFSGKSGNGNILSFQGGSIPNAVPDTAVCVITGINEEAVRNAVSSDCSGAEFSIADEDGNIKIRCTGRSAHASTPESGINAVTALLTLLSSLPLSDGDQKKMINGLCEVFPSGETDGRNAGMKRSDERSGALTLVFSIFGMTEGTASGCIDVRFPVCMSLAEVEKAENAALAKAGCRIVSFIGDEPHITDENSDFVKKLLAVYERCEGTKGKCIAIGGGTYVHCIEGGVAFGVERGDTDYHMHGANEWITTDELLKDAVIFAEAIIAVCGEE
ncbi:MAG: peptidase dimerization domain-containing protein [Ruminiclostridium sp.]|nr:peptidase dimerization domain-containing protein [Ruminiclostridium sp.]